jgi:hypothetical protein
MDPVAVYGAVVATIVLLWDGVKWYADHQAKLDVHLSTGMRSFNIPELEGKDLMVLRAINMSSRATTITHMTMQLYPSWLAYIRRRPSQSWIVVDHLPNQPLPYVLEPGKIWAGTGLQTEDIPEMAKGRLYVELIHALAKKPIRCRVIVRDTTALADEKTPSHG